MSFSHFPGLTCFSITLDNSLILLLIHEVLDWFGKWFSQLWGFIIFSKSIFLRLMSCLQYNSILPLRDALFIYTIIHHYSMEGYTPIFISSFMWFDLFPSLYFSRVCLCELSGIYFPKWYIFIIQWYHLQDYNMSFIQFKGHH